MRIDNILSIIIIIYYRIISFNFYFPSPPGLTAWKQVARNDVTIGGATSQKLRNFSPSCSNNSNLCKQVEQSERFTGFGGDLFWWLASLCQLLHHDMITIRNFDENFKEKESHQKSKLNLIFAQSCFAEDYKVLSISMGKCILTILSSQIKNSSSLRSFGSYKNPFTFLLHLFPTETKEKELNNYMWANSQ